MKPKRESLLAEMALQAIPRAPNFGCFIKYLIKIIMFFIFILFLYLFQTLISSRTCLNFYLPLEFNNSIVSFR